MATSALAKIKAIREKAEKDIEAIKAEAVSEVVKKISEAKEVLRSLEAEYTELTGKTVRGERVGGKRTVAAASGPKADVADEKELAELLKKAGGKLNRKGFNDLGYNLASAIRIAKEDPKNFDQKQNKAQGSVWLIK